MTIGYTEIATAQRMGTRVSANGRPHWKTGGITISWADVVAVTPQTTLPDGVIVPAGYKYLRYGQVMTLITRKGVQVVTVDATGGTFTLTGVRPDTGNAGTTGAIAEAAAAATVQTALEAIFGVGNVVVAGGAGGPFTVTFQGVLEGWDVATLTANGALLTGGTATATVAVTAQGAAEGKYGPFDPAAADGRQTLTRGNVVILDQTIIQNYPRGDDLVDTDHCGGIIGGRLVKDRVLMTTGTNSLAAGPTVTALEAVMPTVEWATL